MKRWRGQWEPLSGRSGCLGTGFADLVKPLVFETSLSGQQICCGDVHNRDMALDVVTSAGRDVACKVREDVGTCLDPQSVIFAGKRPEACSIS